MKIELKALFKGSLCSFDMAKKCAKAGMTCANTFFAYDEHGDINDGAWLQKISPQYKMYPAINVPFAILMLEDTDLKLFELELHIDSDELFHLRYGAEEYTGDNLPDVLLAAWLKHKK